jgi:hypothetical protein
VLLSKLHQLLPALSGGVWIHVHESFESLSANLLWNFLPFSGKIPYFTTPPMREVSEHAEFGAIVSDWSKEFDVDAVFKDEATAVIAGLPTLADSSHVQMTSSAPLTMDVDDSLVQFSNQMS